MCIGQAYERSGNNIVLHVVTTHLTLLGALVVTHAMLRRQVARPLGRFGGFEPPAVRRGHSQDLRETDEKILGYTPPPPNVVPTNTLVLESHLVTFSESQ